MTNALYDQPRGAGSEIKKVGAGPLTEADLEEIWKAFLEKFKLEPPEIEFKFPFVIAKETIDVKVYVPPPPVVPPDELVKPPPLPYVAPKPVPLVLSKTVSQRQVGYTAYKWHKVLFRDIVTGNPVKIRAPTLVAFGEFREGWLVPPVVVLKEVKIVIPEVPELPAAFVIPKIEALTAPKFVVDIPDVVIPRIDDISISLPPLPEKPPKLSVSLFQAAELPALPDPPKFPVDFVTPKQRWYCKQKDKWYEDITHEGKLNHAIACFSPIPALIKPSFDMAMGFFRLQAKYNDFVSGANFKAQLKKIEDSVVNGANWASGETWKHVDVARKTVNNAFAGLTGQINNQILDADKDGSLLFRVNAFVSDTYDNVDTVRQRTEDEVNKQLLAIQLGLNDAATKLENGFNGLDDTINSLSSQMTGFLNDKVLSDETEGAVVFKINTQIEATNKSMADFRNGLQDTLNGFRAATQDGINVALKEVRERSEWAINHTIKTLWEMLGLAERTVFTPIQIRSVVEDGFEIMALKQDFKLHYLAAGLSF